MITLVYDTMLSHSRSLSLTNLIYIYHKNVIRIFIKILLIQKSIDISLLKCCVLDESTTLFTNDTSFENVATMVNCYQIHQTQTAEQKKTCHPSSFSKTLTVVLKPFFDFFFFFFLLFPDFVLFKNNFKSSPIN